MPKITAVFQAYSKNCTVLQSKQAHNTCIACYERVPVGIGFGWFMGGNEGGPLCATSASIGS